VEFEMFAKMLAFVLSAILSSNSIWKTYVFFFSFFFLFTCFGGFFCLLFYLFFNYFSFLWLLGFVFVFAFFIGCLLFKQNSKTQSNRKLKRWTKIQMLENRNQYLSLMRHPPC
jgi:hypothetical protein